MKRLCIVALLFCAMQLNGQSAKLFVNQPIDFIPTRALVSPDQKFLYLLDRNRYSIRDAETRRILISGALPTDAMYAGLVPDISENFDRLVYRHDKKNTLEILNPFTGQIFSSFKVPAYLCELAISRDGNIIVAMTVKDGYYVYRYTEEAGYTTTGVVPYKNLLQPNQAVISPNSEYLAMTGSHDVGSVTIVRLSDNQPIVHKKSGFLFFSGHKSYIHSLLFSPDSKYLLSSEFDGRAYLTDLQGESIRVETGGLRQVLNARFSADGKVSFCPQGAQFKDAGATGAYSLCLPNDSSEGFGRLTTKHAESSPIRSLIPGIMPDVFPPTQAELGEQIFNSSDVVRSKYNAALKKSVTVGKAFMSKGSGKFTVYDHAAGSPKETSSFTVDNIWNEHSAQMNKTSTTDFALTDSGNLLLKKYHRQLANFDLAGAEKQKCAAHKVHAIKLHVVEYFAPNDLLGASEQADLMLWSKNCQNIIEAADENGNIEEIKFDTTGKFIVTRTQNGVYRIRTTNNLQTQAVLAFLPPDSWAVASADGRYDGQGDALGLLHYVVSNEAVAISDFDKSFHAPGLLKEVLTGVKTVNPDTSAKPAVKVDVSKSMVGKIHSLQNGEVLISGRKLNMGERVYVIVAGKKIYLRVTFPMHTGAKSRLANAGEAALLGKGMPVFR